MRIKIDLSPLLRKLIEQIRRRTLSGKDMYMIDFKPYTPEYAKKKGRKTPNLFLSGQMLNSMIPKTDGIGFSNQLALKKVEYNKERPFFGLDYRQEQLIDRYITKKLNKEIDKCMRKM